MWNGSRGSRSAASQEEPGLGAEQKDQLCESVHVVGFCGVPPADAVAYQILIMFMIAATTALGVIILCLIALRAIAGPYERVKWEVITRHDDA